MEQRINTHADVPQASNTAATLVQDHGEPIAVASRHAWKVGLLPGLVAVITFAPVLKNGFVDWDDFTNFTSNYQFRGLGWHQLHWAWTTFHIGVYQPLAWMLLEAEYSLWKLDPWGYHLTSLVLFAVTAVVLDALTVALLLRCQPEEAARNPWPIHLGAALAVALFVAHPLRTEVVAWVSCQPYLPCALFSMLTVLAYLRAHPEGRPARLGWAVVAFLLFVAALLSKAVAAPLPLVFLILDVYPLRRLEGNQGLQGIFSSPSARWAWIEKLPYMTLSLVFMILAVQAKNAFAHLLHIVIAQDTLAVRSAQACYGVCFYLAKTIWPFSISPFYPLPLRITWSDPLYLLAGAAVAGLTVLLILIRRRQPWFLAAWVSYLVFLAPNSGLIRIGCQMAADRYANLAMTGLVVLAAAGLSRLMAKRVDATRTIVAGLTVVIGLTTLSWTQCRIWSDSIVLWTHALTLAGPDDAILNYYLGIAEFEAKNYQKSLERFTRALRISPSLSEPGRMLGVCLLRLGRVDAAEPALIKAVELWPDDPVIRAHYGELLLHQGRPVEAEPELEEAVRLAPGDPSYRRNLGSSLLRQGKLDEAAYQLEEALKLEPGNADSQNNLGTVRARQGRLDEALGLFTEVLRNRPGHIEARMNLASTMLQKGQVDEAEAQFNEVLRQQPGLAAASNALAEIARAREQGPSP
jgi:Flp pilus assembly protein TadD